MDERITAALVLVAIFAGTLFSVVVKNELEKDYLASHPNVKVVDVGTVRYYYYELPENETPTHAINEIEKLKSANN